MFVNPDMNGATRTKIESLVTDLNELKSLNHLLEKNQAETSDRFKNLGNSCEESSRRGATKFIQLESKQEGKHCSIYKN